MVNKLCINPLQEQYSTKMERNGFQSKERALILYKNNIQHVMNKGKGRGIIALILYKNNIQHDWTKEPICVTIIQR